MESSHNDVLDLGYNILNNLEIVALLGEGSYGSIYKVKCLTSGKLFALKALVKFEKVTATSNKLLYAERNALVKITEFKIPFNLHLRGAFQSNDKVFFLSDIYKHGNLEQFLQKNGPLDESDAKHIVAQILHGLGELHKNGIFHRDLKLDNILINDFGVVTICDFGLSKIKPIPNSDDHGHFRFKSFRSFQTRPPVTEEVNDLQYLSELMKSLLLGRDQSVKHIKLSDECEELIQLLAQECVTANPIVNVDEVKMHRWFEGINWETIQNSSTKSQSQPLLDIINGRENSSKKPFSRFKRKKTTTVEENESSIMLASHFFDYDSVEKEKYLENFDYLSDEARIIF